MFITVSLLDIPSLPCCSSTLVKRLSLLSRWVLPPLFEESFSISLNKLCNDSRSRSVSKGSFVSRRCLRLRRTISPLSVSILYGRGCVLTPITFPKRDHVLSLRNRMISPGTSSGSSWSCCGLSWLLGLCLAGTVSCCCCYYCSLLALLAVVRESWACSYVCCSALKPYLP